MKKAKIMLAVIAMFGAVGGALAYKASKFHQGTMLFKQTNGACATIEATTYVGNNIYNVILPNFSTGYFLNVTDCALGAHLTYAYSTNFD
jgi:hypothetical protein